MPADKVRYYNKIDMGIFLSILEICLKHAGFDFSRELFIDNADASIEKVKTAEYTLFR